MVVGVGLPLVLQEEAVIIGTVLKSGYFLPNISTAYTNPSNVVTEKRRKKRSFSRWDIYEALSQILEMWGKLLVAASFLICIISVRVLEAKLAY